MLLIVRRSLSHSMRLIEFPTLNATQRLGNIATDPVTNLFISMRYIDQDQLSFVASCDAAT